MLTLDGIACTTKPAEEVDADVWIIGPEAPLVSGLADRLRASGRLVLGPGADGSRLEGSKAWMKDLLSGAGVPTAPYGVFDSPDPAEEWMRRRPGPWVVKTDGLAAGKGVLVTGSLDEAVADVRAKLSGNAFGDAGRRVVVEEGLSGPELSLMALCDGRCAVPLAPAQDFKRLLDGDKGPNTGGMGSVSPPPRVATEIVDEVMASAVEPTLAALGSRGIDYRGILYAGLMLTDDGPKVLEFNVRFGDPEAQVLLARWRGDVAEALLAAAAGRLDEVPVPAWSDDAAVCVVIAADGYPERPRRGDVIEGLARAAKLPGVHVLAAGVDGTPDDLVTAGGRVINVIATAAAVGQARERAYAAVGAISWPGMTYRRDIGLGPEQLATKPAGADSTQEDRS
jgi:phosphoribosylamine--glycine ligase